MVQIGSDAAVMFTDSKYYIGRISRIRRRNGKSWVEYTQPVDLSSAKESEVDLLFIMCWYKQNERNMDMYEYGTLDTNEIELKTIICPVTLAYNPDNDQYKLPAIQNEIIQRNLAGEDEL